MNSPLRVAVVGAGSFGRNHIRVVRELGAEVKLTAIVDPDLARAHALAAEDNTPVFASVDDILGRADAAIVAAPTVMHEPIATRLLESGIDVLVEKPIAESTAAGQRLANLAQAQGRILQVGHLERFNPAVAALQHALTIPLFFEVHRLSVFTPRSLDVDVILDLMIHDLDIILAFTGDLPNEIRAAGISVLSGRVDIANVRLSFASGCVANLTASRVSTEQVRKLRLFQPGEYISLDYHRQEAVRLSIRKNEPSSVEFVSQKTPSIRLSSLQSGFVPQIDYSPLPLERGEPLKLELQSFFAAVRNRTQPLVDAFQAVSVLRVAESILAKIQEHGDLVAQTLHSKR